MPDEKPKTIADVVKQSSKELQAAQTQRSADAAKEAKQKFDDSVKAEVDRVIAERDKEAKAAAEAAAPVVPPVAAPAAVAPVTAPAAAAPATVTTTTTVAPAAAAPAAATEGGTVAVAEKAIAFKALGVDEERGVIYGVAAVAGNEDLEGEILSQKALYKMSGEYTSKAISLRKATGTKPAGSQTNHKDACEFALVESFLGVPIYDKAGKFIAVDKTDESQWIVGIKPSDPEIFKAAKAGEIVGLSWGGWKTVQTVAV